MSDQQQQQHQQRIQCQAPPKRAYTGVDKLILAAMIDDAQAGQPHGAQHNNHHLPPAGFIPSGRGIGYGAAALQRDTFAQIPAPSNRSEYELYRLLERANLLNYFGTFLNFGGDDVQQLCDADEEEFLEIMILVGMTQKPLHVRRLQKALIEWKESRDMEISMLRSTHMNYIMTQPAAAPLTRCDQANSTTGSSSVPPAPLHPIESRPSVRQQPKTPTEPNQYIPPRDLLVGAPKRLRLLDSLNVRQCNESDQTKIQSGPNQSPFKKRFSTTLNSTRRTEDRSDEDGSEEEGDIDVLDSPECGCSESGDDEDEVSLPRKLTRASDRGSPKVVILNQSANNGDASHRSTASPNRSLPHMPDQSHRRADNGHEN